MAEKIKILYVDDELNNLISFKAAFRFDYHIYTADNTEAALELLTAHPDIRIVFSDQRMPDKTGVEFLSEIRGRFPRPIRILLTAYADLETVVEAINKGHVFRFVRKPWIEAEIISAVEEGNMFYVATSMLSIKNEELQTAYNELDKFAYSVSHDLREPLSGILSAIHMARQFDSVKDMQDLLRLMEKSVTRLNAFILSLHDYYATQRGELTIAEIDFKSLLESLKDIYTIHADTNGVNFVVSLKLESVFRSDEVSLKLILNNLLSNAFKYQRKGEPNKSISVTVETNSNEAIITVKDNGVGIADQHVEEIFNLFYRANHDEDGAGIGLYNVKSALAKLNGKVNVSSIPGEGTTFRVTIPGK